MFLCLATITSILLFDVNEAFSRTAFRLISNAKSIAPESFPYIAELNVFWPNQKISCTANLLSRSVMITAGHCVVDEKTKRQPGKVTKVLFRPNRKRSYVVHATGKFHGMLKMSELEDEEGILDYALFELERPLPVCRARCGRIFSIIKLPVKDVRARKWEVLQPSKELFDQCSFFSYGASEEDEPDGEIRKLTNISVSAVNGRLLMPMRLNGQHAGQGRICRGDSGGSFICGTDFGERIYGILSYSRLLLESYPSSCHGEDNAFLYDVMADVRKMLPSIQTSFAMLNKTNELIEDYERCNS
ncbi:unnamed protein product [Onchocerca flexuosa]|nr:unnamed protein product [Onchocerca flexuosa]